MKRILIVCPFPENLVPGQRLKFEQYYGYFRTNGYEIEVRPFFSTSLYKVLYIRGHFIEKAFGVLRGYWDRLRLLARLRAYDGVYVFLYVTPLGTSFFERAYRLLAKKLVYDIDDLVFLGRSSPANSITSMLRGRGKYHFLMAAADHVITCTPYLDAYVRRFNTKTTDISSTIRTDDYVPLNAYSNDRTPVLGWSGSHTTAPYLNLIAGALRRLRARRDFRLLTIGAPRDFMLDGLAAESLPWTEPTEVHDLQRIDIGLYPLPDEEWVLGKSGLKALQYMALGIPTVATNIGANPRVIEDGRSGFLVRSEDEWVDALERLIADPELRRRMGTEARLRVERLFSVEANKGRYLSIFHRVYGKP